MAWACMRRLIKTYAAATLQVEGALHVLVSETSMTPAYLTTFNHFHFL